MYTKLSMDLWLIGPVCNAFDAGKSITWTSGRGLCPGNLDFFGPQMVFAWRLDAISQGPKRGFARIQRITYGAGPYKIAIKATPVTVMNFSQWKFLWCYTFLRDLSVLGIFSLLEKTRYKDKVLDTFFNRQYGIVLPPVQQISVFFAVISSMVSDCKREKSLKWILFLFWTLISKNIL